MSSEQLTSFRDVEALYTEYGDWLDRWLRRKLGHAADAADLTQDTFLRVLGRLHAQPAAALIVREPYRYLATIANGLVADHWRRQRVEQAYLEELARRPEALAPSPEERLVAVQTLCELDAMLDRLPAKARRAFLLARLDGLGCGEIAGVLGVSDRMVRKYLAQAMYQCLLLDVGAE
ncbi:putative RNA polymerase sigma factor FecI [Pigmentiphaga humi]|uniref:Putative RNA polymerase sigma factor FecI n=1 Tax=Pigmentiphaga humi TaxID=2478468 RepID=A0A3P4AX80_9BURK|nr:sigma-70 family RNA polymerase sigma factor [Pigmentiphaga humi]VCU68653.1 putative RNA polymerase sigma factor FecI [Pigmentiphaga humi]